MGQFPTRSVQLPLPTSKFVGSLKAMDTNLYFLLDTFQPGHKIFLVWAKQMDAVSLNFQNQLGFSFVLDPYLARILPPTLPSHEVFVNRTFISC